MGDEILMKKLWILPLLALYLHSDQNRIALVADYKSMFEDIGKKRTGVSENNIDHLKSPFVVVEKPKAKVDGNSTKEMGQVLQVIVNKRAKISGKWYGVGEMAGEMKVVSILKNEVTLKSDEKTKRLKMRNKSEKFSIK
jgi:hypothetical protein